MNNDDIELGYYNRVFARNWWMFLVLVPVCAVLAVLLLPAPQSFFTSTVSVLLSPGEADLGTDRDPINEDAEVGIAVSPLIGDRVVAGWGQDLTLDEWRDNLLVTACLDSSSVVVSSGCNTGILEFSYRGDTRGEASGLVDLSASEYLEFRREREVEIRESRVVDLEAAIADKVLERANAEATVRAEEEGSFQYDLALARLRDADASLRDLNAELRSVSSEPVDPGSLLGDASTPERDSAGIPRAISLFVGALMGLLLAAVAAVLTERLKRTVTGPEEIEADLGIPVLGNIPRITQDTPALITAVGEHSTGADAFRRLAAAALVPRSGGYVVESVAVTSPNEREGRTTIAVNMALAFAQSGRDVILISADRRNRTIDQLFGLGGHKGLNDFLRSDANVEVAHSMLAQAPSLVGGIRVIGTGTGSPPPLSSSGLAAILAAAHERNVLVVFDTPPSLSSADGLLLASLVDAVFVVAAAGRTRRNDLNQLRVQLLNVQADVVGAIVNNTSRMSLMPSGTGDIGSVSVPMDVRDQAEAPAKVHSIRAAESARVPQASPSADDAEVVDDDDDVENRSGGVA